MALEARELIRKHNRWLWMKFREPGDEISVDEVPQAWFHRFRNPQFSREGLARQSQDYVASLARSRLD